jgi:hypothetical protein
MQNLSLYLMFQNLHDHGDESGAVHGHARSHHEYAHVLIDDQKNYE